MTYSKTFALATLAAAILAIMHNLVPGTWAQWAGVAVLLALACVVSVGLEYKPKGDTHDDE